MSLHIPHASSHASPHHAQHPQHPAPEAGKSFVSRWWKKAVVALILVGAGAAGAVWFGGRNNLPQAKLDLYTVAAQDLKQVIKSAGTLKATENVDLSFEASGRIVKAPFKVGDSVKQGEVLAAQDQSDLSAQLASAGAGISLAKAQIKQGEADIAREQAKLDELKRGPRLEDLQIALTALQNAKRTSDEQESNLAAVQQRDMQSLSEKYSEAVTAMKSAAETGRNMLSQLADIQYGFLNADRDQIGVVKAQVVQVFLGQPNAGLWARQFIQALTGGVYGRMTTLTGTEKQSTIDVLLSDSIQSFNAIKSAYDSVPYNQYLTSANRSLVESAKAVLNDEISTLTGAQSAIALQYKSTVTDLSTAQGTLVTSQNAYKTAQRQLTLIKAGAPSEQVRAQQSSVDAAKASLESQHAVLDQNAAQASQIRAQMQKRVLVSPLEGTVTLQDAKVGAIASPGKALISLISKGNLQVEAPVSELDVTHISIGDAATVTLDATGEDTFKATVRTIDPGEVLVDNVPTYKVTFDLVAQDPRLKSGMTATVALSFNSTAKAITVPGQAIHLDVSQNPYVMVAMQSPDDQTVLERRPVKTGIRTPDNSVQILEGLQAGEKVVLSTLTTP